MMMALIQFLLLGLLFFSFFPFSCFVLGPLFDSLADWRGERKRSKKSCKEDSE